jgi:peptidoglycan/LPS O-acetylase OafA/YrhL
MFQAYARESFYHEKYFPSIDGLRTLSIVPVVWHHCTPFTYPGVLGRGGVGVELFFAISGFLITTLLLRERFERSKIDLSAFYVRRSFRIFPLYYLVLGANVVYALWVRPKWGPSEAFLDHLGYYLTYTANWFQGTGVVGPSLFVFAWSLCTEEQFYVFWAPLLRFTKRLSFAAWWMGGVVFCDLVFEFFGRNTLGWVPNGLRVVVTSFSTPIGFGALCALAAHHPRWGKRVVAVVSSFWCAPIVFAVTLSLVIWPWAPVVVLHGLLAGLVLVCAVPKRHGLSFLLNHPVFAYVGRISYGIYLWHVAVIGGLKALYPELARSPGLLFALAMPLSLSVAAVSYKWFERPLIRLGRRWNRNVSVEPSTTAVLDG